MRNATRAILRRAIFLCLIGCGGSEPTEERPGPTLDAGFSGTWTGTTTYRIEGMAPLTSSGSVRVTLSDSTTMIVTGVCPNGQGQISASGVGNSVGWTGQVTCAPVAFADCASVIPTYSSASISLISGPSLSIRATGTATGCGVTRSFSAAFDGGK